MVAVVAPPLAVVVVAPPPVVVAPVVVVVAPFGAGKVHCEVGVATPPTFVTSILTSVVFPASSVATNVTLIGSFSLVRVPLIVSGPV